MALNVVKERCPQDHYCPAVMVCPVNALSQKGIGAPEVDEDTCTLCGKCVRYCPTGALVMTGSPAKRSFVGAENKER